MSRNVFISFLGEGFYYKTKYNQQTANLKETRFIQCATLEYLEASKWEPDSKAYILLTQVAHDNNWIDNETRNINGVDRAYNGLHKELQEWGAPFDIEPINIPNGNDMKEMFSIFTTLFSYLQEGDKLYLDMTHGFRYLPMFLLVLGNYAQFLKNVEVRSITYGNVFSPTKEILDLMPLCNLQNWTIGAADFVRNGNVSELVRLSDKEMIPIIKQSSNRDENTIKLKDFARKLDKVIEEIKMCRCKDVIEAKNLKALRLIAVDLDMSQNLQAFEPIQVRILDSLRKFSSEPSLFNGLAAAEWCMCHGLFQQSISYLEETIVSFFCKKYNVPIYNTEMRTLISSCFGFVAYNTPEQNWRVSKNTEEREANLSLARIIVKNLDEKLAEKYCNMADIRNDINHAGMRDNSQSPQAIKKGIAASIDYFTRYFDTWNVN